MSEGSSGGVRIGVFSLLGVMFVGLKLGGVIDWSWWWVTLPFWGIAALIVGGVIFVGIGCVLFGASIMLIEGITDWLTRNKEKKEGGDNA